MNIKIKANVEGITNHLGGMLKRTRLVDGWLNRVAYPTLIRKQRERWQSEGNSEGSGWKPLKPDYAAQKLKKFRDYPGAGHKMLIATSRLVNSITGDDQSNHYKLVGNRRLEMGTTVPYAKWVNQERNFLEFSEETISELRTGLKEYLMNGKGG